MNDPRLPGIGRGRRRVGRTRRALDAYLRTLDLDAYQGALVPVLRSLADDVDRLDDDPEHSAHTMAVVCRTLADQLAAFRPVDLDAGWLDPFDELSTHVDTATQHNASE